MAWEALKDVVVVVVAVVEVELVMAIVLVVASEAIVLMVAGPMVAVSPILNLNYFVASYREIVVAVDQKEVASFQALADHLTPHLLMV